MTRKLIIVLWLFIYSICCPVMAVFNSNGERGVVRTLTANTHGKATINLGAGISFQQSSDYLQGQVSSGVIGNVLDRYNNVVQSGELEPARLFSSNIFVSVGPLSIWDIALSFPFYYDWSGIKGLNSGGIGDLEFSTKLKIPTATKAFSQAFYFATTIPVGMKNNGLFPRHPYYIEGKQINPAESFYSSENASMKLQLLLSFDISKILEKVPVQIHTNVGAVGNLSREKQRNTITGGIAMEYMPADFISLFVDFYGESRWSNFSTSFNPANDPVFVSPGVKLTTPSGMYIMFSGDFSLSSKANQARLNWNRENYKYSTAPNPRYGMQFVFGWNGFMTVQDEDRDGIKNDKDRCPKDPEDKDGFEDEDGCPDPDNDKDGILDINDKCPDDPEDKDGFEDDDGCPDPDNDGDKIPDTRDKCPGLPEDYDGYEDNDGCPDPDNDNDGIVDSVDQCPDDVEDFDNFEDEDGCPDLDNDKDGIPDLKDLCPNEPETFNNYKDDDGCPDTVKKSEPDIPKHQIVHGISFRTGSSDMSFDSYQYLEPIVKQLKQYPEVEIEIRGHTDSVGSYQRNMELSQMRAESVRKYFLSQGISAKRVSAVGFGPSSPVGDNKTAAGRAKNRRIEIVRIK